MWSTVLISLAVRQHRSFSLSSSEVMYIREQGLLGIQTLAYDMIVNQLRACLTHSSSSRGSHCILKIMIATGTCCRKCLWRQHGIPAFKELVERDIWYCVDVVMAWLKTKL